MKKLVQKARPRKCSFLLIPLQGLEVVYRTMCVVCIIILLNSRRRDRMVILIDAPLFMHASLMGQSYDSHPESKIGRRWTKNRIFAFLGLSYFTRVLYVLAYRPFLCDIGLLLEKKKKTCSNCNDLTTFISTFWPVFIQLIEGTGSTVLSVVFPFQIQRNLLDKYIQHWSLQRDNFRPDFIVGPRKMIVLSFW